MPILGWHLYIEMPPPPVGCIMVQNNIDIHGLAQDFSNSIINTQDLPQFNVKLLTKTLLWLNEYLYHNLIHGINMHHVVLMKYITESCKIS